MNHDGTCPELHPQRGSDGLSLFDDFEVIGSENSDDWGRCRRCGRWFWLATDVGGKYEYVGGKEIDRALAERAFLRHELDAVVDVLLRYELPHGPVWTVDSALLSLLRKLAPDAGKSALAAALLRAGPMSPWSRVRRLLEAQAQADRTTSDAPSLPFELAAELAARGIEDVLEMPSAIVLYRVEEPFELIRIDAGGTVARVGLAARPRYLAGNGRRALFAMNAGAGEAVFALGPDGSRHVFAAATERYLVQSLDDGFWLFAPQGDEPTAWAEVRRPNAVRVARLLMPRMPGGAWYPPPLRRMAGGWVASGVLDINREETAISLYGDDFALLARSLGPGEARSLAPVSNELVVASTLRGTPALEGWAREGEQFVCAFSRPCRSSVLVGGRLAVLSGDTLSGIDVGGSTRWSIRHGGALHLAASGDLAVAYGERGAVIASVRTGDVVKRIDLRLQGSAPELLRDASGALYLRDDRWLWIIHEDAVKRVTLPFAGELVTTAAGAALVGDSKAGRYALVGADGEVRGRFEAQGARFSVVGTRAGPYVLEADRIRIGAFWRGDDEGTKKG